MLALLAGEPKHGYQLKTDFESATGAAWPLNVGQVYTTLQRLERDGLVEPDGSPDEDGRLPYAITPAGTVELRRWLTTPTATPIANRDETSMRLLLALATETTAAADLLSSQRQAAMATLQSLTAMKAESEQSLAWRLQLDRMIFLTEAEIRWLDLTEERLVAEPPGVEVSPSAASSTTASTASSTTPSTGPSTERSNS